MVECPACHTTGDLAAFPLWEAQARGASVRECGACGRGIQVRPRVFGRPRVDVLPMPAWNAMLIARRDQDAARNVVK